MAKKNHSKKERSKNKSEYTLQQEVISIALLAVTIFLFLCNFGFGGVVGGAFSSVMFGLFGLRAFVAPVVIALLALFFISNSGNTAAVRKIASAYALFFMLGMMIDLFAGATKEGAAVLSPVEIYKTSSTNRSGAGVLAALIVRIMYRYLSVTGTVLLLAVFVIICLVILTDKSFIRGVREGSHSVMEHAGSDYDEFRKHREDQKKIRKEKRRIEKEELSKRRAEEEERRKEKRQNEERLQQERELEKQRQEDEQVVRRIDRVRNGVTMATDLSAEGEAGTAADATVSEAVVKPEAAQTHFGDDIHEVTFTGHQQIIEGDELTELTNQAASFDGLIRRTDAVTSDEARELMRHRTAEAPVKEETAVRTGIARASKVVTTSDILASDTPAGRTSASAVSTSTADAATKAAVEAEAGEIGTADKAAPYKFPPLTLLNKPEKRKGSDSKSHLEETAAKLEKILKTFGVNAKVVNYSQGPAVTRYELQPEIGVKVARILNLSDDIKLNLAATDIRIEAPIPGKVAVGIEVPNTENVTVTLRELLEDNAYAEAQSRLTFAVGKDIAGETVVTDIAKMPHLLIAGSTGSGKSVCINTMILSLLYKADPREVKLVMIDPKVVELSIYNGIPHLLIPVVTDPKKAAGALNWAVAEMEKRYKLFAEAEVRDLAGYNKYVELDDAGGERQKLPQIVVIVDELADLMMVAKNDVETAICRLAQLARAAGIHLIIATQRPSVDVITGLIKANMPSRIAFAVSSGVDSRTILDMNGAEKLLGKGDMLFFPQSYSKPVRVQGAFVSDKEIQGISDFLKKQNVGGIDEQAMKQVEQAAVIKGAKEEEATGEAGNGNDELFEEIGLFLIDNQDKTKASIGSLQRKYRIGFNRAARIMDQLCDAGVVSDGDGTKPRTVLMSRAEFLELCGSEGADADEMS